MVYAIITIILLDLANIEFQVGLASSVLAFSSAFFSALLLASIIRVVDKTSIVSARRILAVLLTATLVWTFVLVLGIIYYNLTGNVISTWNAFLFGAFLAACLQLIIFYGAFSRSIKLAFALAFLHPSLLLTFTLKIPVKETQQYVYAPVAGSISVLVALLFLFGLKRIRTQSHGLSSIQLLQAFLKTWVSKNPDELERCFSLYATEKQVKASVIQFIKLDEKIVLVVPGVHPGPFFPVGSYNIPELIYARFKEEGIAAVVLHSTGGHERNLPTKKDSRAYIDSLVQFTKSLDSEVLSGVAGPIKSKIGKTNISSILFDTRTLTTISTAPYESDDIEYSTDEIANKAAGDFGFEVLLVDAHNSIGGETTHEEGPTELEWKALFASLAKEKEYPLTLGHAHSSEIDFRPGIDICDGGLSVLLFQTDITKSVLVVADSNNVITGLREELDAELQRKGFALIELCTSDTHKFAARTLTERGYFALGESTKPTEVIATIMKLVEIATEHARSYKYRIGELKLNVSLVGRQPLDEFADVTRRGSSFAKRYTKVAAIVVLALLAITLI